MSTFRLGNSEADADMGTCPGPSSVRPGPFLGLFRSVLEQVDRLGLL